MARVLVAGCGYVGAALAGRLVRDGHEVFGLRRGAHALPPRVSLVRADVTDPRMLGALPRDLETVFYTVAADGSSEAAYRAAYVDGLRNVLGALRDVAAPPRRLIVVTSTAVYGQDAGEWVDENSETNPVRFQGRVLLESEAVALDSGVAATAVRFGGIYGPGRTRLIDEVRRGEASLPTSPSFTNRIHLDDCAGVLRHLMNLPQPERIYLGVDREPADTRAVITWLATRLGAPVPREAPMGETADRESESAGARGKRCSSRRLTDGGYVFQYPTFREGYGALIDATRS